jgi:hypothetical protein
MITTTATSTLTTTSDAHLEQAVGLPTSDRMMRMYLDQKKFTWPDFHAPGRKRQVSGIVCAAALTQMAWHAFYKPTNKKYAYGQVIVDDRDTSATAAVQSDDPAKQESFQAWLARVLNCDRVTVNLVLGQLVELGLITHTSAQRRSRHLSDTYSVAPFICHVVEALNVAGCNIAGIVADRNIASSKERKIVDAPSSARGASASTSSPEDENEVELEPESGSSSLSKHSRFYYNRYLLELDKRAEEDGEPGWWCTHAEGRSFYPDSLLEDGMKHGWLTSAKEQEELAGEPGGDADALGDPDPASTPPPGRGVPPALAGPRQLQAGDIYRGWVDDSRRTERIVLAREEDGKWLVYDETTGMEVGYRTPDELHAMQYGGLYPDAEYAMARKREKPKKGAAPSARTTDEAQAQSGQLYQRLLERTSEPLPQPRRLEYMPSNGA